MIEDEVKIADTLRVGLSENGYDVIIAYNGMIGHKMYQNNSFDIIVLDINLPELDGYQLCKIIREDNKNIPVIILTALSTLDDKIEGYDAGADDYITKPFEFKELLMKIRVLLRRASDNRSQIETVLHAGNLTMNLDTKEVKRDDVIINLTAKEFQLLEYLLRNKNRVVSRADIAINVWDIDFDSNTNIIDVYINYIRNKVDKPFPEKLIQTQVGMGYALREN